MTAKTHSGPRLGDGPASYGLVSRINHWTIAALFLGALLLGLFMEYSGLPREQVSGLMPFHKLLGVAVLLFGLWRVGWRVARGFPAPVSKQPHWQDLIAKLVHWVLLAAILLMPLSGVATTLAGGRALEIFGLQLLPAIGEIAWLDAAAGWLHGTLGLAVTAILVLHIGAALKHQLVDHDGTLVRMTRGQRA
jgi:cytochrome b561